VNGIFLNITILTNKEIFLCSCVGWRRKASSQRVGRKTRKN